MRFKGALFLGDEANLYYMRARWYEPQSGRFLSEDPIGLAGGLNGNVYGGNDPVNGGDPFGLCDWLRDPDCAVDLAPVEVTADAFDWGYVMGGFVLGDRGAGAGASLRSGGYGDGSYGSGAALAAGVAPPSLGQLGPSCGAAVLNFLANLALDAFTISGVGSGLALAGRGLLSVAAGEALELSARSVGTLGVRVAGRQGALTTLATAGRAYATGGAYLAGVGSLQATIAYSPEFTAASAASASSSGGVSWKNFIPGYGTYTSGKEALSACH